LRYCCLCRCQALRNRAVDDRLFFDRDGRIWQRLLAARPGQRLSGLSNLEVTLITTIPSCVGLLSLQLMGWSSDRSKERRLHTAVPMLVAAAGFLLAALLQNNAALAVAMLCLVSAGVYGYQPSLWSLPARFLTGAAAAATFGMMNTFGNMGGFLGPYAVGYLFEATNRSFTAGLIFLSISAMAAGCFILALRPGQEKAPLPESRAIQEIDY
jgi:sugar phosphate permease